MQPDAAPISSITSGTGQSQSRGSGQREQFTLEEAAVVLSNFDIGIIESVMEYPRGSRKAPKLVITSEQGKFLLKRRAKGRDDPFRVAFSHALQLFLASKQFPLPHLIGTRKDNNSMFQWRKATYELFEYIPGQNYPQTLEATFEAGRVLAEYHKLLHNFESEWKPATGSYHKAPSVEQGLKTIPATVGGGETELRDILCFLLEAYRGAAAAAEAEGLSKWPQQIVHADWHPGNMIFRGNNVAAVIDYDAARRQPRVLDVANGALQFSILSAEANADQWPDYLDESRFKRFLRGYDEVMPLSEAEIRTVPWLMSEALIAEAVFPIAATGSFGRMEGTPFLKMVRRKVEWLRKSYQHLVDLAGK
jgi:homoserine kinase type II